MTTLDFTGWLLVAFMFGVVVGIALGRWRAREREAARATFRAEEARWFQENSQVGGMLLGPPPDGITSATAGTGRLTGTAPGGICGA